MLSKKHLQDVCLCFSNDHRKCRYIGQDDYDLSKYFCAKKVIIEKNKIDAEVKVWVDDCKARGLDPLVQGVPLGDNCEGYPVLRYIEQGYDKP